MAYMLHNMSMRPSSRVEWGVQPVWNSQTGFDLERTGWPRGFLCRGEARLYELPERRQRCLLDMMEADWQERKFTGAALMYSNGFGRLGGGVQVRETCARLKYVTEPLLVLNVLARTRGGVLMYQSPAWLDRDRLERTLYTLDPRFKARVGRRRRKGIRR